MDLLLTLLGLFGLIPVMLMGLFYTVIPVLLVSLQVLGITEALRERRGQESLPAPDAGHLERAA